MISETQSQKENREGSRSSDFVFEGDESLSIGIALKILQRDRRLIFRTTLVTLFLATILAFVLPPTFTATASFVPPGANNPSSAAALMGQLSALGAGSLLGGKSQGDLYIGILKSQTIARILVQHFDLMHVYKVKKESLAEKKLKSRSSFESGTKDPIVIISVVDRDPERARDLAKGYLQALQETSAGLALTESSQRRLFFEQRLAKEKDELADAEIALKLDEEKSGLVAPSGQLAVHIQQLAQVQAQITARQTQLASMLLDETEQNPEVLQLRSEISSLQSKAAQMTVGENKSRFGSPSTAEVPSLQLEYIRKSRDVKYHEALFEIIAKQYEAARLDEAKDSPLQILDQPTIPDTKSGPMRSVIIAIGFLIGFFGSSAWSLFKASKILKHF